MLMKFISHADLLFVGLELVAALAFLAFDGMLEFAIKYKCFIKKDIKPEHRFNLVLSCFFLFTACTFYVMYLRPHLRQY